MVVGSFAGSTPIFCKACSCAGDSNGFVIFVTVFVLVVTCGVEVAVIGAGDVSKVYNGRRLNGSAMIT